ncbi:MAG: tRNA lysidine(34) synthetase TilS, partial [Spirochaetales bacterium]
MEIEDRFQLALEETGIFGSSRCLIAFSGGSDSAALSALCAAVMPGSERVFTAARVSHGIRSWNVEEQETEFCRNFCARIGIPFAALGGTSAVFSSGTGLEAAARNYRYGLLEQHRKETQSDFILFAHTLEDNRETLLMRVLSGSGPEGLKGIPSARGCIRRPLLSFTRGELQEYLQF